MLMLKELIDDFYSQYQRENKEQANFYVTDAGKCPRAVFFKFKNAPREKMDPRILRIFEHGEYLHRNIFNILYRLKIGVTTEVPIPPQGIISGRADAIICMNNENYVLDIKSMNSFIFKNLTEPKEENVYQIQLYLHYFQPNISKGILLYIDKDKQNMKEFIVPYDASLSESLVKKFEGLKEKIDSDTVPKTLPDYPNNWQCGYCQFKDICRICEPGELPWQSCKTKIMSQNPQ